MRRTTADLILELLKSSPHNSLPQPAAERVRTLFTSVPFFSVNLFREYITWQLHPKQNQNQPFALIITLKTSDVIRFSHRGATSMYFVRRERSLI